MINMSPRHLDILRGILREYPYTFYMFGSRITPRAKVLSDVDLFHKENIPEQVIHALEGAFEESDLPYKVDLINYNACDSAFQKIMDAHHEVVPR